MTTKLSKWTGKHMTGLWSDAKNWSAGVPVANESVMFSDTGTWTISLAGSAPAQGGSMTVTTDVLTFTSGTLALAAPAAAKGVTYDLTVKGAGSVTVAAGATLTAANAILLGGSGTTDTAGTLAIAGSVTTGGLYAWVGALSVTGATGHLSATSYLEVGTSLAVTAGAIVDGGGVSSAELTVGSGGSSGNATVTVDGAGSQINIASIYLGNGFAGSLTVQNGATVTANVLNAGLSGDGFLAITGAGSDVSATGMTIGGDVPVASTVSVTAGGSLTIGANGLTLEEGTIKLDATATLSAASIVSLAGRIEADAVSAKSPGTVTLTPQLTLGTDGYDDNQLTNASTTGNAVLNLAGGVSGSGLLQVGAGHVILSNTADSYAGTEIYSGTLEVTATGAAGAGALTFLDGTTTLSLLQIDTGASFGNTIEQFYLHDEIDLQGFAFASGVTGHITAGTLTLNDGSATTSLVLTGSFTDQNFTYGMDKSGGTTILYHATKT